MHRYLVWRGCTLRIFAIGDNDPTKNEEIRKGLQKYIYMLRIDADVFMVELLDTEVSDEVVEKTAELEKQQQKLESIRNQIRTIPYGVSHQSSSTSMKMQRRRSSTDGLYRPGTPSEESEGGDVKLNVLKMNTAVRFNHVIMENSPNSQL
ncbi:hypothetical protein TELCIR_20690, partial [Teladorsagia circumcincta]